MGKFKVLEDFNEYFELLNKYLNELNASPFELYEIGGYAILSRGDKVYTQNASYIGRQDEILEIAIEKVSEDMKDYEWFNNHEDNKKRTRVSNN